MRTLEANPPYIVAVFGRTGMGKSTTGNKLLNAVTEDNPGGNMSIKQMWPQVKVAGSPNFKTNHDAESVTKNCSLLSSMGDGEIRVLDTEGFAGSDSPDVHLGNLKVARAIAGVSDTLDLAYDRVLYFLPIRGKLERADATLQDEIEVMWHYFGNDIFKYLVLATTLQETIPSAYAPKGENIQRVFSDAMQLALSRRGIMPPPCPPVLFIPLETNASALLKGIKEAVVHGVQAFKPQFRKEVCIKCACELKLRGSTIVEVERGRDVCSEGHSKCHPFFIPKYTTVQRIVGGIIHVVFIGAFKAYEWLTGEKTWPGFFSSEEICANCKEEPGSKGCMRVKVDMYRGQYVEHGNNLHSVILLRQ